MNRIHNAFDEIRADEELLKKTAEYLKREQGMGRRRKLYQLRQQAVAAAAILLLVVGVFSHRMMFTAAAYVSIEVNPAVELKLNRINRVIGISAWNDDGQQLISDFNINGRQYEEAAAMLVGAMKERGYITDDALVSVTVQSADSKHEQIICSTLQQSLSDLSGAAGVEVFPVSAQVRQEAGNCHISPARYVAIQELLEVDDTATLEQYRGSDIGQIRQRTRQCRQMHEGQDGNRSNAPGHGKHNGRQEHVQ